LLKQDIFCWALDASCSDVGGACHAVPVGLWYLFQVYALEVVGCVAAIAYHTSSCLPTKLRFASCAWSVFQEHLAGSLDRGKG